MKNKIVLFAATFWMQFLLCQIVMNHFSLVNAHPLNSNYFQSVNATEARYLGNEAVMVSLLVGADNSKSNSTDSSKDNSKDNSKGYLKDKQTIKILFDPFFESSFGIYTLVPDSIRQAIQEGKAPYDNIEAVFISHAHADHFDSAAILRFMKNSPKTKIFAPTQAINSLRRAKAFNDGNEQLVEIKLEYGSAAVSFQFNALKVDAVRIPHAGWPQRSEVENIVYRVTLGDSDGRSITVMHLGDADPNDTHFKSHNSTWTKIDTDVAFPPYWFFLSSQGVKILEQRIRAKHNVGIHVDTQVPASLRSTGRDFFSTPGEIRLLETVENNPEVQD